MIWFDLRNLFSRMQCFGLPFKFIDTIQYADFYSEHINLRKLNRLQNRLSKWIRENS
jgi:hypothetical protein